MLLELAFGLLITLERASTLSRRCQTLRDLADEIILLSESSFVLLRIESSCKSLVTLPIRAVGARFRTSSSALIRIRRTFDAVSLTPSLLDELTLPRTRRIELSLKRFLISSGLTSASSASSSACSFLSANQEKRSDQQKVSSPNNLTNHEWKSEGQESLIWGALAPKSSFLEELVLAECLRRQPASPHRLRRECHQSSFEQEMLSNQL